MDPQASLEIVPIAHPLNARVSLPGSKSLTNRALLLASLAEGRTTLTNALYSDDSSYFAESLQRLGFEVGAERTSAEYSVQGLGGRIPAKSASLYVGNAGTAARFLTAFVSLGNGKFTIDGDARMRQRPIGDLVGALTQLGVKVACPSGSLPLTVQAKGLAGGVASISGEVSSQFLSGLLMAAPYAHGPVSLSLEAGLNSRPYIDMTLSVMADFGVDVVREDYRRFEIFPARYHAMETYVIEPDASAASYFFAAAVLLGGTVRVEKITRRSRQGDITFLDVLEQMGCQVKTGSDHIEVTGVNEIQGVDVDMRDISDTAQTLAVLAPFADSPTTIRGIGFIRAKETDRIGAVCAELARLGVRVEEHADGMTIHPCKSVCPGTVRTYNDHRMVMAFALIGLRVPGIRIEDPGCVSKTFPAFFEVLESLR